MINKHLYGIPPSVPLVASPVLSQTHVAPNGRPRTPSRSLHLYAPVQSAMVGARAGGCSVVVDQSGQGPVLRDNGAAHALRLFVLNEGQPSGWPARALRTVGRGSHPKDRSVSGGPAPAG